MLLSTGRSSIDQQSKRSHPNKAVDVVARQTFQITLGFGAINLCLLPWSCLLRQSLRLVLSDSMACFPVGLALAVRQPPLVSSLRTCPGAAARIPLHSPRGSAARRRASAPPLPPLSSSHSSHPARTAAAHTVVSPCPVRTAPRYSARFLPHISTLHESVRILQGQYVGQRRDRPYPLHLPQ